MGDDRQIISVSDAVTDRHLPLAAGTTIRVQVSRGGAVWDMPVTSVKKIDGGYEFRTEWTGGAY